jgi:hypothetical protein
MTPKEKAEQLVDKFRNDLFQKRHVSIYKEDAILIALIAVDEILASKPNDAYKVYSTWIPASTYWRSVKEQIQQL